MSRAKGYQIRKNEGGLYHGHSTAKQYIEHLGYEKFSQFRSFGLVRNPYDWHVSLYSYMRENPQHPQSAIVSKMSFQSMLIGAVMLILLKVVSCVIKKMT